MAVTSALRSLRRRTILNAGPEDRFGEAVSRHAAIRDGLLNPAAYAAPTKKSVRLKVEPGSLLPFRATQTHDGKARIRSQGRRMSGRRPGVAVFGPVVRVLHVARQGPVAGPVADADPAAFGHEGKQSGHVGLVDGRCRRTLTSCDSHREAM